MGYLSAVLLGAADSKLEFNEGWKDRNSALSAYFLASLCFSKKFICYAWCLHVFFPVALLEAEAGEGEPGKMQLQFLMQEKAAWILNL